MYYLKLFDKNLLSFNMDNKIDFTVSDINIIEKNNKLFPFKMIDNISEGTLTDFLKSRIIPKNRWFVNEILKTKDLNIKDTKGIIDVCKGLSLNDSYWVVEDENLKFADYNLYDNEFSETLSLVAFTGYTSKVEGIITSPEFTTNGYLPKAWRRIENEVYLYKGSTEYLNFSNTGNEPYSEYYSSQIAKKMGINAIEYDLTKWKDLLCSTCKLFTSKEYSYVQIADLMEKNGIEAAYETYKKYGLENDFKNMILFDSIIYNPDRHFGNFGFLRNNTTGEIEKSAPIFDNGAGLFVAAKEDEIDNINHFNNWIRSNENVLRSNYGSYYDDLVKEFCDKEQIPLLRKLLTFEFTKHEKYNLSDERLHTLSFVVQKRARELIDVIEGRYRKEDEENFQTLMNSLYDKLDIPLNENIVDYDSFTIIENKDYYYIKYKDREGIIDYNTAEITLEPEKIDDILQKYKNRINSENSEDLIE